MHLPVLLSLFGCPANGDDPTGLSDRPTDVDTDTDTGASTNATGDTSAPTDTGSSTGHTGDTVAPFDGPHNVLLVLVDDISPPKVGHYGESTEVRTPVIDGLAADGVWFRNAWAAPSCSPTRAAFQTGRLGRRTGFGAVQQPTDAPYSMQEDEQFLPALLAQGPTPYATELLGKWHLGPAGDPVDRGWGSWQGALANLVGIDGNPGSYFGWRKTLADGTVVATTTYVTTDTTDDAILAIQSLPEPWLVHVSYNAAHSPFEPPPEALHSYGPLTADSPEIDRERAVLEAMDTELGRVLAAIEPDVRQRTTVFVVGDNGEKEEVREPGSGPGGKLSVFDGGVRVPFIVEGSAVPARGPSEALVHVVDVVPTVLDMAGLDPSLAVRPDGSQVVFDGRSLVPLLSDPTLSVRDFLYTEVFEPNGPPRPPDQMLKDLRTVRNADYKLIVDSLNQKQQLYAYTPDHPEQQPENLLEGELTPAEQAALDALRADLLARFDAFDHDAPH